MVVKVKMALQVRSLRIRRKKQRYVNKIDHVKNKEQNIKFVIEECDSLPILELNTCTTTTVRLLEGIRFCRY